MWVAELGCVNGHAFEGWFGSRDEYDDQAARGLVQCPRCGSAQVQRRLTAPRLNLGAAAPDAPAVQAPADAPAVGLKALPVDAASGPAQLLRELVAAVRARSEDLGRGFAAEARRIHQGDAPERPIRGQASAQELEALHDEGIEVWPLPQLDALEDGPAH